MKHEKMVELKEYYKNNRLKIKSKLKEFKNNNNYFYELCFCLLTPQSSAKKCYEAISILKAKDFFNKEVDIKPILKTKTRFYRNKSGYLLQLKKDFNRIQSNLSKDSFKSREFLVKNVKGLGYKESAHFLRNIGYRNLAILDRHILKNLLNLGIITEIPKSLSRKNYLEIESKFKEFSRKIKISMDELDLLFWYMQTGEVFR